MNLQSFGCLLTIGIVATSCGPAREPADSYTKQTLVDTISINQAWLSFGFTFNQANRPVTYRIPKGLLGGDAVAYRVDTLATTEKAYVLLIGRLYPEETIGRLVTINRANRRQIDNRVVYYDNAEGMIQTESQWLPGQQRAIVKTGTYDETGRYRATRTEYKVMPNGTFEKA